MFPRKCRGDIIIVNNAQSEHLCNGNFFINNAQKVIQGGNSSHFIIGEHKLTQLTMQYCSPCNGR